MNDSKVVVIEVWLKKLKELKDGEDQRHEDFMAEEQQRHEEFMRLLDCCEKLTEEFMRLLDCCEKLTADIRQAADDMRERANEHE